MAIECRYCNAPCGTKEERYVHQVQNHPVHQLAAGRCYVCDKPFGNFFQFFDHIEEDHPDELAQIVDLSSSKTDRLEGTISIQPYMLQPAYLMEPNTSITLKEIVEKNKKTMRDQGHDLEDDSDSDDDIQCDGEVVAQPDPSQAMVLIKEEDGTAVHVMRQRSDAPLELEIPREAVSPATTVGCLDDTAMEDVEEDENEVSEQVDVKPIIRLNPSVEALRRLYHPTGSDEDEEEEVANRKRRQPMNPSDEAKKHRGLSARNPNIPPLTTPTGQPLLQMAFAQPAASDHIGQLSHLVDTVGPTTSSMSSLPFVSPQPAGSYPPSFNPAQTPWMMPPVNQQLLQEQFVLPDARNRACAYQQPTSNGPPIPPPMIVMTPYEMDMLRRWNEQQQMQFKMAQQAFMAQQGVMMMNPNQFGNYAGPTAMPGMFMGQAGAPYTGSMNLTPNLTPSAGFPGPGPSSFPAFASSTPFPGSANQMPSSIPTYTGSNSSSFPVVPPSPQFNGQVFTGPMTPSSMVSYTSEVEKREEPCSSIGPCSMSSERELKKEDVMEMLKSGELKFPVGTSFEQMVAHIRSLGAIIEDDNRSTTADADETKHDYNQMPSLSPTIDPIGLSPHFVRSSDSPSATVQISKVDSTDLFEQLESTVDDVQPPVEEAPLLEEELEDGEIPSETQAQIMNRLITAIHNMPARALETPTFLPKNAPPCQTDKDYWTCNGNSNSCPRCGYSSTARSSRVNHYKKFHYGAFYTLIQAKMPDIERWLSVRLGHESDDKKDARNCTHCTGPRKNMFHGRLDLLNHIQTRHNEQFVKICSEYSRTFVDTQCMNMNLHRLLVSSSEQQQ